MNISGETLYIGFHQVMFLITGLCTTLGTQWLFYHGAASKSDVFLLIMIYHEINSIDGLKPAIVI